MYVDQIALSPDELQAMGPLEWRGRGDDRRTLTLREARMAHERMLVRFMGTSKREGATELTNGELWGESSLLPDPGPGVVYTFQLVGLRVVDQNGRALGLLKDVVTTTAQPLYLVDFEGHERLYPGIPPFVKHVNLAGGVITMELPPGFEELGS
jgi:16S rRNA processing protein RimM